MIKFLTLLIALTMSMRIIAQNDTIYLMKNHIILNDEIYNKIDSSGKKTGKWINFTIDNSIIELTLGSGENVHSYDESIIEYRALEKDEYFGMSTLISEKVDTIDNVLYYDSKYLEIRDKVPEDLYFITSIGDYNSDKKQGLWNYFYESGNIKKTIYYLNGLPNKEFEVYRDDKTLMIEMSKTKDRLWEVKKFKSNGTLIDTQIGDIEKFKIIYE